MAALAVVNLTGGIPGDAEADTLAAELQDPLQMGFLALAALGGALAWCWEAAGAMVMAGAAAALGLLAAFEYPWAVSVGVALVFAVPAVLVWLAWRQAWGRRR
ncbi:MAG: hypothetical protein ACRD0O_15085, partial [Acidimicrobiia bacterium]